MSSFKIYQPSPELFENSGQIRLLCLELGLVSSKSVADEGLARRSALRNMVLLRQDRENLNSPLPCGYALVGRSSIPLDLKPCVFDFQPKLFD